MKTGVAFFSDNHHGEGGIDASVCENCLKGLRTEPFVVTVYFRENEIHFQHVSCALKAQRSGEIPEGTTVQGVRP